MILGSSAHTHSPDNVGLLNGDAHLVVSANFGMLRRQHFMCLSFFVYSELSRPAFSFSALMGF